MEAKTMNAAQAEKEQFIMDPDHRAEAAASLGPNATNGDKLKALRLAQNMTYTELSRRSGMTTRAIRYMEDNERNMGVEAIQKLSAALGVTTDYFMDNEVFQQELKDEEFYRQVREKYGSRGVAQAKKIKQQTAALFAGGDLSEHDRLAFIEEMEQVFMELKEEAREKYNPHKNGK